MTQTYKPETTQKRIAEFKAELDAFTDLLYKDNYVPDSIYSRDRLYSVMREVKDWLKWQKTSKDSERIFQGITDAIARDSECYVFPERLEKSTFIDLLHLDEVTEKLIDGTYHLTPEYNPDEHCAAITKEGENEYLRIVIKDENNERIGNYAWLQLVIDEFWEQFVCGEDEIPHDDE